VLQLHQTRLESVQGETIWAQRLLRDGACLYNRWPEQSRLMAGKELARGSGGVVRSVFGRGQRGWGCITGAMLPDGWHVAIGAEHLLPALASW
jgi:hypothetical protein